MNEKSECPYCGSKHNDVNDNGYLHCFGCWKQFLPVDAEQEEGK